MITCRPDERSFVGGGREKEGCDGSRQEIGYCKADFRRLVLLSLQLHSP